MNNSNSILLIDPSFDPANALSCNLLIKVGLDSFSYAIIDHGNKKVKAVFDEQECENGAKKLEERLKFDPYLKLTYREVKIAINTVNTIAIPNDFYDVNDLSVHAQYFNDLENATVYAHVQDHFGFTTVFSLPKLTKELLENHLQQGKKYQEFAGLLSLVENIKENTLILDVTVNSLNMLYLDNNRVEFQQCYEIADSEEFNYYILLIINQLNINTKETTVLLSGIIHEGDEKYQCLSKYFNEIRFTVIGEKLDQEVLDDMPAHYYSSLLALDQCV
jgi:uncharacterized protein YkvS